MDKQWLFKQFLNSRLTPHNQKKELIAGGFDEDVIDEALDLFYQHTGRIRQLTPPHMLVEKKKRERQSVTKRF